MILQLQSNQPVRFIHGELVYNISVNQSEVVALVGNNGVGKSSFIQMIKHSYKNDFSHLRWGFLDQGPMKALNHLRGKDLFSMLEELHPERVHFKNIRDFKLLDIFEFREKLDRPIASLSGGENQMLKILSLFYLKTDVYILDEPANHLDESKLNALVDYIIYHKKQGTFQYMLVVDHKKSFLKKICDGFYIMQENNPGKLRIKVLA